MTERERRCMTMITPGLNDDTIGRSSFLRPTKDHAQFSEVMVKLGGHGRRQLAAPACRSLPVTTLGTY
ncbi:MAG TPA: hypothetical protein VG247_21755 [Pseudonocardiaceae bacterium]|nr:hypothetical protein [Pseudonocardiaceae bacterium]